MNRLFVKLGNMRKPQDFVVYPEKEGKVIIQSNKSIGIFDIKTSKGLLNTKGCYFPHLNPILGAEPFVFPDEVVYKTLCEEPKSGDLIGSSSITGPVYWA